MRKLWIPATIMLLSILLIVLSSCNSVSPVGEIGANGKDGQTPFIGDNGNWWIGDADTGVKAKGDADTFGLIADDTPILLSPQQTIPVTFEGEYQSVTFSEVNLSLNNFNDAASISPNEIIPYRIKVEVKGNYSGEKELEKVTISPRVLLCGSDGMPLEQPFECDECLDYSSEPNGNFSFTGWIYTYCPAKYFYIYGVVFGEKSTNRLFKYDVTLKDNEGNAIEGAKVKMIGYPGNGHLWFYSSLGKFTDKDGKALMRISVDTALLENIAVKVEGVPDEYILPESPIFVDVADTSEQVKEVTIIIQKNGADSIKTQFERDVCAFQERNPLYVSFAFQRGGQLSHIEWYETDEIILMQVPSSTGSNANEVYYKDKTNNIIYEVDLAREKLSIAENPIIMWDKLIYAEGIPTKDNVSIDGQDYDALTFRSEDGAALRFICENDMIKCIELSVGTNSVFYQDLIVANALPSTSVLVGIQDYEKTGLLAYRVLSSSMQPSLIQGNTYYFRVINSTMIDELKNGDIILVKSKMDLGTSEVVLMARRIVQISDDSGKKSFSLKGDNNSINDNETYFTEDIIGVLYQ